MKLFVDDVRDAPDDTWTVVRKVEEAIVAIAKFRPTHISLDHDIENRPSDETFKAVAYFIGALYWTTIGEVSGLPSNMMLARPLLGPTITIHSANPVGAQQIHDILKSYGLSSTIIHSSELA